MQKATAKKLENSLTQNEDHRRRCSLFSIERQFPKLDVAGSIPVSRFLEINNLACLSTRFLSVNGAEMEHRLI